MRPPRELSVCFWQDVVDEIFSKLTLHYFFLVKEKIGAGNFVLGYVLGLSINCVLLFPAFYGCTNAFCVYFCFAVSFCVFCVFRGVRSSVCILRYVFCSVLSLQDGSSM